MKTKGITTILVLVTLLAVLIPAISVKAADSVAMWPVAHYDFTQGLRKDGSPVLPSQSNPDNALGAPDGNFVSLGFGGSICFIFQQGVANGPGDDILVIETTEGTYPLEEAEVYACGEYIDGSSFIWELIGVVDNAGHNTISLPSNIKYIWNLKIVDISDPNLFGSGEDGFDIDAVGAYYISWWVVVFAYDPTGAEISVPVQWSYSLGWSGTENTLLIVDGLLSGTFMTLTVPEIFGDYEFDHWGGNIWPPSTNPTVTVGIDVGKVLYAYYKPKVVIITVNIEIKPGSDPNSICLKATGLLPVAILGSETLDVTEIDTTTIKIGEVTLANRGSEEAPKLAYSYEDVNGDGFMDLVAFFSIPDLVSAEVLKPDTTALTLTAILYDGTHIEGTDSVRVVPP